MARPKLDILLSLGSTHRIASDGIQWILQHDRDGRWVNLAYCLTIVGLERGLKPYGLSLPDDWPVSHKICLQRRAAYKAQFKSALHV